jgi:cell division transport system permease protein
MHALQYFFVEAAASLWRSRGSALLAILTIAAGLFVLGFFLLVNVNLQPLVSRWTQSAELSIYLTDTATPDEVKGIEALAEESGLVADSVLVSKDEALRRFRTDFPDLAPAATGLKSNPLPASLELRLRSDVREVGGAIDGLVEALAHMPGVADVRYDREWLGRLNAVVRGLRLAGLVVVAMLTIAAAMTVGNVVRLAAAARSDEIEIMQLVGAPFAYVRGPFVAEGILQGGLGAVVALVALALGFFSFNSRYGPAAADTLGTGGVAFLPAPLIALLVVGGMLLGCVGGYAVARRVR